MSIFSNFRSSRLRSAVMAAALALPLFAAATPRAHAGVFISVNFAPPALPVYVQPPIPGPGYIWTPGYWAWGDAGYYWVPGTWVLAPRPGFLWTPGYWGWGGGVYLWHPGYWGPHVGFYGGVNYGFGYGGVGFCGGEWRGGAFFYNSAVVNYGGTHITNVYVNRTIVQQTTIVNVNHVAYNGPGGINRTASPQEQQWSHENHLQPTAMQQQHQSFAAQDRTQYAAFNHGRPGTMAAANVNSYHQVAQQHMRQQPLSAADRNVGRSYNPNTRMANQDQRISNGLRSGQMTAGEASRAEATQSRIDQQVRNDRAANGGTLTQQERNQVGREQNAASRQIYNENHNGNTVAPNAVDNRMANQQQRTANGLRSGQMTAGEAARTDRNQANTAQQVHNDRVADGGALNQQQRQQINRQQNRNSRQIYNEKHNAPHNAPPRGGGERRR